MTGFDIPGNPGAVLTKAGAMRTEGARFTQVAVGLRSITTEGWKGRAADRFRTRFDTEPLRWEEAGAGFTTAAGGLESYAAALRLAQQEAQAAAADHARGDAATGRARTAYDNDVRAGEAQKRSWEAENGPGTFTLTIHPFHDPGEAVRQQARQRVSTARSTLQSAADAAAHQVRVGCAAAPEKRNWLESGLAFVGGVLYGAGEAVWDLVELVHSLQFGWLDDLRKLATGELTPEELAVKLQLKWETVQGMWTALSTDPVGFGQQLGKALLDWDTWADDPARALGHLVPDAAAAFFTGGAAAVGTRGLKGAEALAVLGRRLDDLLGGAADANRALDGLDAASDLARFGDRADALADLTKYDDAFDIPHPKGSDAWVDEVVKLHPDLSRDGVAGIYEYTTNAGYSAMNPPLRGFEPMTPSVQARIDNVSRGLDDLPSYEGTTYRGTNLPQSVLDEMDASRTFSDRAFMSSSTDPSLPKRFLDGNPPKPGESPCRIEVQGHSGSNIAPFSHYGKNEAEILFDHGTGFEVVSKDWNTAEGRWDIVLKET